MIDDEKARVIGEAHTVMMGFERFEFRREGNVLILHGPQTKSPILPLGEPLATPEESNAEQGRKKG
jgi:hypothetical protein